jgi:hypothetical protein
MEKKYIHFFGCSFTVGHELPDNEIFPWKKDCKTDLEYNMYFTNSTIQLEEYTSLCKSMAFPSIIEKNNPNWLCINHAECGSSVKAEIFKSIKLIEDKSQLIDYIIFQMPAFTRELTIDESDILENISISFPDINSSRGRAYATASIASHSLDHWTIHALIDLILFEGYLISKNIKYMLLDINGSTAFSIKQLINAGTHWNIRTANFTDLKEYVLGHELGQHFDQETHYNFARVISEKIRETII